MKRLIFFPSAAFGHGQAFGQMEPALFTPAQVGADGEPLNLRDHALRILARASLPKYQAPSPKKSGGMILLPWHGRAEVIRYRYAGGRVLIHDEDAGTPWGAAFYLALEALAPERVSLWQREAE